MAGWLRHDERGLVGGSNQGLKGFSGGIGGGGGGGGYDRRLRKAKNTVGVWSVPHHHKHSQV